MLKNIEKSNLLHQYAEYKIGKEEALKIKDYQTANEFSMKLVVMEKVLNTLGLRPHF